MKKHRLLIISLLILAIAVYTVNSYNPTTTEDHSTSVGSETTGINSQASTEPESDQSNPTDSLQISKAEDTVVNEKALDFTLVDLEGNEVTLSDYKGKKVFLNFWATWCPPCKAEMPEIEKIYQETKDSDLVILAVEIGEPLDTVKTFIEDKAYHFKVLLDLDQSVSAAYGISAIPTSFFIDTDGNIVAKKVGGMSYDEMKEYSSKLDQ